MILIEVVVWFAIILASVYLVRDPRNIITSIAHHYEFSTDDAYEFLTNKGKVIFDKETKMQKTSSHFGVPILEAKQIRNSLFLS